MLARRSRREETLEEYFYDKIKLVSHCNIKGKDAVDCVIEGIFDHNVRLNAQGANFERPSKLLRYQILKAPANKNIDLGKNNKVGSVTTRICYNCSEPEHTAPKCRKEPQKCTKCTRIGHMAAYCRRDTNADTRSGTSVENTRTNETPVSKVQRIIARKESGDIYNKIVKINDHNKTAFVDFGSQCTIIKWSVAQELHLQLDDKDLPLIKGFAFGSLQPMGKVSIDLALDFIKAKIDAYVVPDKFLSSDLLVGQNVTEMSDVTVYKTSSSLILHSDTTELEKILIYNMEDVILKAMQVIQIRCNTDYTGHIYIPGNTSFKEGEEIMILPGLYFIENSTGYIPVITLSSQNVKLKKDRLLARARMLPIEADSIMTKPPAEFEVRKTTLTDFEVNNDKKTNTIITIDMLNLGEDLTQEYKQQLLDLLNEFRDCFALSLDELGMTHITEMHIDLQDSTPISYKPYRLPFSERLIVRDIIDELLESKIVQESNSSYASPIVLVKKKNGEHRLCVDYRALNKKTVKDSYPMPVIDDQLDRLSGKVYFTSLDLKSGYYQIPMAEKSRHLTAFVTPDGHYEYTRMPFGLVNAPAVFQHMVNKALGKDRYNLAIPYMDDLLSPASSVDEGLTKLRKILVSLRNAGLTLNLTKCFFFAKTLDYLGYEVSNDGLRPGSKKIEAVSKFPTPTNVHQIRQFVGLASFFRRFIAGFARIAKPLTVLTKSNVPWKWGQEQEASFQTLKAKLVERPILALYDPKFYTEVHCDASKLGVGGMLLQRTDEKSPLKAVAYYSKQTTKEEEHLHSYELETLAVVLSLKKFRTYLIGIPFKVYTDCNALRTTLTKRDLVPRIARWWLLLQEYNFTIEHRPGDHMRHVDALSRNPIQGNSLADLSESREYEIMNVTTTEWLHTVQMTDPKLKLVKNILDTDSKEIRDIVDNYILKDKIVFGRKTTNPSEGSVLNSIQESIDQTDKEAGPQLNNEVNVNNFDATRDEIRSLAMENTEKNQCAMKTRYDNNRAPTTFFNQGDLVMIPNNHVPANGKSKKLCPKFRGPFRITAVLKNDRYEVSTVEGHAKRKYKSVYPADSLKKWITFSTSDKSDREDNYDNTNDSSDSTDDDHNQVLQEG
ncbi:uncharacterized protein [Choristoneura fumiferana]|uniref:uncharacterized protein n=1 Tax=Choristoneura fumiferana TaxID=7141 RepID=UPI003D155454